MPKKNLLITRVKVLLVLVETSLLYVCKVWSYISFSIHLIGFLVTVVPCQLLKSTTTRLFLGQKMFKKLIEVIPIIHVVVCASALLRRRVATPLLQRVSALHLWTDGRSRVRYDFWRPRVTCHDLLYPRQKVLHICVNSWLISQCTSK